MPCPPVLVSPAGCSIGPAGYKPKKFWVDAPAGYMVDGPAGYMVVAHMILLVSVLVLLVLTLGLCLDFGLRTWA